MRITIDLQPEIERGLSARAQARGVSLADLAGEILAREARCSAAPVESGPVAENLYDLLAPVRGLLTDEEVDHYFGRTASASR